MELESLPLLRFEPALHLRTFMGAVVVHDEVRFLILGELLFEKIQELFELPAAVALLASADDFAQSGGAIALVVVRLALQEART